MTGSIKYNYFETGSDTLNKYSAKEKQVDMEIEEAKRIVSRLANGADPVTGEVLPNNSPYNNPAVIRALFTVLSNTRVPRKFTRQSIEEKQDQNISDGKPRNAGLPWTKEAREDLASMFNEGKPIKQLAKAFERTEGAIFSELIRQGLIEESERQNYRFGARG
jgi:hypothetical protein